MVLAVYVRRVLQLRVSQPLYKNWLEIAVPEAKRGLNSIDAVRYDAVFAAQ